ncbi:MAG: penicillin-binding protein 1C [Synergistaceae bacterium]|jgi:penicillin-binding protein 1C|nr:penicillin-binding protein 1C [Synergistaceae bacterium]
MPVKFSFIGISRALLFISAVIAALSFYSIFYLEREYGGLGIIEPSKVILDSDGKILNVYLSPRDEWCIPVSLEKMGRWTPKIAVEIEDKRFYSHGGVDFIALGRALFDNIRFGKVVSGASTITAQLIRISNARPRTLRTKLLEFWGAMRIESEMNKNEILELYLNLAPFGGNIRGIEAASRAYFNKSASELSLGESTLLISLVRGPSRLRPDRYPERARNYRDYRLEYLFDRMIISRESMEIAKKETVSGGRFNFPRNASMAAMHILNNSNEDNPISSYIDSRKQSLLEQTLISALAGLPGRITASGIIIDNENASVLAYVGNARHGERLSGAQVDCGAAPRSPGSTLKPFVYVRAFEQGYLTPGSLLADTPLSFRGNAPRNYDQLYRGPVSARSALSLSLNTPAVRVLRMIGYPGALDIYARLGFRHIDKRSSHYADSLVLGGCETTLLELASAYSTLARGGIYNALNWTSGNKSGAKKIFSPEASWIITNILQDERRLIPLYQQLFKDNSHAIAFKTGTSHGLRDAWCAGYSRRLTIVIWFGIPDGSPDDHLVGLDVAAPPMLKVFRELWNPVENTNPPAPQGIFIRKVCALSGAQPNRYCGVLVNDYAIKDISSLKICAIHKFKDDRVMLEMPEELSRWTQLKERVNIQNDGVKIVRPVRGGRFVANGDNGDVRLFFSAEGNPPYYWYIDGAYAGVDTIGDGIFFDLLKGSHRVSVLSGSNSDFMNFAVIDASRTESEPEANILN